MGWRVYTKGMCESFNRLNMLSCILILFQSEFFTTTQKQVQVRKGVPQHNKLNQVFLNLCRSLVVRLVFWNSSVLETRNSTRQGMVTISYDSRFSNEMVGKLPKLNGRKTVHSGYQLIALLQDGCLRVCWPSPVDPVWLWSAQHILFDNNCSITLWTMKLTSQHVGRQNCPRH